MHAARLARHRTLLAALCALAALGGCASTDEYFRSAGAAPAARPFALGDWPHPEVWAGVVFNGEKIGFTRRVLRAAPDAPGRWDIESEAAIRLRFLGIDKRVNLRARERVREDLTLERFRYQHEIDGSTLVVSGRADREALEFTVEASGVRETQRLELAEPLYPTSAVVLLPALRGMRPGQRSRYAVFQGEAQRIAHVEQHVVGYETSPLFEGPAYRVESSLLGMDSTTWIAADGRPLFELGLHGAMITALEDQASAKRYLVEASLNKSEALVEFSLLRSAPIARAREVSRLEIALAGVPKEIAVPSDATQACERSGERVRCTIRREAPAAQALEQVPLAAYLRPTLAAPSIEGDIVLLARQLAAGAPDAEARLARALAWIEANIAREAIDVVNAVDVLRERRAECQGHSYLLAALARAMGIAARVVNGVAYSERHGGFLYHTWNEVWLAGEGWRPVDATFGQARADATHVKLIEGENPGDLVPLVGMVGKAKIENVRALDHW